ncbi:MAG: PTS sugar transporter subunit IIA [Proteobacteria bacterium]|nr:PTS sugar transporter subunit IIA [Pseudomonadota bacterium]MBU1641184.1 PTS sugar transporter subunit IIA [Pseudomonadota bacterium]
MSISIPTSHIIGALVATSKRGVLAEMTRVLTDFDQEELLGALFEREAVGSTAIDSGIAVPHVKFGGAEEIQVCFARSLAGIPWGAADRQLVHLIFMMVAPVSVPCRYLETLAILCRFLRDRNNRSLLLHSSDEKLGTFFATAKELK